MFFKQLKCCLAIQRWT